MTEDQLRALLTDVQSGATDIDTALERVRHLPFEDIGFAKLDHHRALRHGMPEVVFGLGKSTDHVVAIAGKLLERSQNVLITRTNPAMAERVMQEVWRYNGDGLLCLQLLAVVAFNRAFFDGLLTVSVISTRSSRISWYCPAVILLLPSLLAGSMSP